MSKVDVISLLYLCTFLIVPRPKGLRVARASYMYEVPILLAKAAQLTLLISLSSLSPRDSVTDEC